MSTSNTLEVFAHGEYRRFTLIHDDITSLRERIDLLILSSYGSQITGRTPGTVIHKLREKAGISLEQLKESPELDLTEQLNLWVSRETGNSDLRRIMCIQYETTNRPEHITEQAFRALPILESSRHCSKYNCPASLGNRVARPGPRQIGSRNYCRSGVVYENVDICSVYLFR